MPKKKFIWIMNWNINNLLRSVSYCAIFFGVMYALAVWRSEFAPLGIGYDINFSDIDFWLTTIVKFIILYVAIVLMQRLNHIGFNLGYRIDCLIIAAILLSYIYFDDRRLLLPLVLIAVGAIVDSVNIYLMDRRPDAGRQMNP